MPPSKNKSIKLLTLYSTFSLRSLILNNNEFFLVDMIANWVEKKQMFLLLYLLSASSETLKLIQL